MLITLLLLSLAINISNNLPVNKMGKMPVSEPSTVPRRTSTVTKSGHSKRSTIRSSFMPLTTKRTAQPVNLKEPVDPIPPVTPVSPVDAELSGPATLHVMSATPLKPMTSSEDMTTSGPLHPEFFEPGCICCCHETEIHEPVLPKIPVMLPPLNKPCLDCGCGNCTNSACKPITLHQPPCHSCPEGCIESNFDVSYIPKNISTTNNKHPSSSCQPVTCSQPNCATTTCPCHSGATIMDTNCQSIKHYPPCITKCNNNYLGNDLQYAGMEGKQPTTRTLSTTQLIPMKIKFTETTAQAEAGYNPIQPMPTIPAMNPDDIIVHHIVVAQPMVQPIDVTQIPSDYIIIGNPG